MSACRLLALTPASRCRLAAAAALALVAAASAADPLTLEQVATLREVTSAKISPDGARIAYTLRVPRTAGVDPDGPAWSELHVTEVAGKSRPYVAGRVNVGDIAWRPDGAAISFTARLGDDEHTALYEIPIDGGQARRLFEHKEDIGRYAWSADSSRIAFIALEPEPQARAKQREAGFSQEIYEEDQPARRVFIAGLSPATPPAAIALAGTAWDLAWSPDLSRLLVAVAPTRGEDAEMMFSRLELIDATSLTVVGNVQTAGKIGAFVFSPDSRSIALIGTAELHDPLPGRLELASAQGGSSSDLLPSLEGHVQEAAWQNNETVMYVAHVGCYSVFGKTTADGRAQKQIVAQPGPVLYSLSLSADGRSGAYVAESPLHPGEVYFMRHGEAAPRRVTDSNPWLAHAALAKQEVVRYKARDGLEIEGVVLYPLNHDPAKRYPLVVMVHGGPEAHVSDDWLTSSSWPAQVFAARGYACFFPNYRGSTGRGVGFSKADHKDPAGKQFDDIVDGVDYLVERGLVDRERVGITGASYGGYASAWAATALTERYAAAVMSVGLSDLTSFFGTTDIPYEMNLVHLRTWPWEDWKLFAERSPITHAPQARTPLLILHGKADDRVHPSQSMELYRYLRVLGKTPVRLVLYPGEGHGNSRAASRYDYSLRLMQWMEHYLSSPDRRTTPPPPYEIEYKLEWKPAED